MAQRDELSEDMRAIPVDEGTLRAFNELAYTAYESGLTGISFHDYEAMIAMIRLVRLAERHKSGVPNRLRM